MNFLKRIWRRMFGVKTGSFDVYDINGIFDAELFPEVKKAMSLNRPAYDPSTDEQKILMGEVESYFD